MGNVAYRCMTGVDSSIDVFFKMADCLGLSEVKGGGHGGSRPDHKDTWGKKDGSESKYHCYQEAHPKYGGLGG